MSEAEITDEELNEIERRIALERATDSMGINDFGLWRDFVAIIAALRATRERLVATEAVCDAAKAEVVAAGYRSSDMARALETLFGEFWYEEYFVPEHPPCSYAFTVEMDDGPLERRCRLPPHGSEREHDFGRSHPESERGDVRLTHVMHSRDYGSNTA